MDAELTEQSGAADVLAAGRVGGAALVGHAEVEGERGQTAEEGGHVAARLGRHGPKLGLQRPAHAHGLLFHVPVGRVRLLRPTPASVNLTKPNLI